MKGLVIELYEFSLIEGIKEESLVKAIDKAQIRFFRKQEGFIRAEIFKADDRWIKISYWNSKEEAVQSHETFLEHSSCLPFVQMISPSSVKKIYLYRVKGYRNF